MFSQKFNNAALWDKIQKLRDLIKQEKNFKKRKCWKCSKDLNIYDFLSDNLEYRADEIFSLWQNPILEFHCCECYKELKAEDLKELERKIKIRHCADCGREVGVYAFSKKYKGAKLEEMKELWLDPSKKIFCSKFCMTHFFKSGKSIKSK